jgi:hypothetical protein
MPALTSIRLAAILAAATCAWPAAAQPVSEHQGQIVRIYPDPGDFVVELNVAGRCGSRFFHTRRSNVNFREMVGAAFTAFATARPMGFYVTSCMGDRNIASHGYIVR